MKKTLLCVLLSSALGLSAQAVAEQRFIINYNNGTDLSELTQAVDAAGGQLVRVLPEVNVAVATAGGGFADTLDNSNSVQSVGPAFTNTLPDTPFSQDAQIEASPTPTDDLFNAGLVWGVNRVHAPEAWANGITGSHDTVIAIIDTGIASNHPDLAPNLVYVDCYTSAGSFADGACNPYPAFSDHGTHVAGTAAAAFDGGRVVGVAPEAGLAGYNTFEIIPGCGVCSFSDSRWAAMIDAANRGFEVISMSLGSTGAIGGPGSNNLAAALAAEKKVANLVRQAGTTMVASSGNANLDLNGTIVHLPGDIPQIINVGAIGYSDPGLPEHRAFYSNFGAPVDISAPGGDCGEVSGCSGSHPFFPFTLTLSTVVAPSPACAATASCPVGYGFKAGTSMATPHVSGAAALVIDQDPGLSPQQVAARLKQTADNGFDRQEFGHGVVNVEAATE